MATDAKHLAVTAPYISLPLASAEVDLRFEIRAAGIVDVVRPQPHLSVPLIDAIAVVRYQEARSDLIKSRAGNIETDARHVI